MEKKLSFNEVREILRMQVEGMQEYWKHFYADDGTLDGYSLEYWRGMEAGEERMLDGITNAFYSAFGKIPEE